MIRNNARKPEKYLRNPKNNPGNVPFVPTHNFDTKGGVDHKTTMIDAFMRNPRSILLEEEYKSSATLQRRYE